MKRWLVIIISIMILFMPAKVQAQEQLPEINRMEVEILPEYDRPEVLVIYRINLGDQVTLPARLEIRIPLEAVQPYNVAMKDVDGQLYNQEYTTEISGEWLVVSLTTPLPDIQIEYYDPRITRQDGKRRIKYTWPQGLVVSDLSISVFQPVNASNMVMKPDMGTGRNSNSSLTQYNLMLGGMKADTPFSLEISYDKPDDILSGPSQPVQPAAPVSEKTTGWVTLQEVLPWILGVLGLGLIGGGGLWYWRSGREFSAPNFRRRHATTQPEEITRPLGEGIFCHKCGRKASSGDTFCRTCGTKLRTE
ncbi:MAG: zinc ribbon domain-containing protein [Anaerolineaceae bacterium]